MGSDCMALKAGCVSGNGCDPDKPCCVEKSSGSRIGYCLSEKDYNFKFGIHSDLANDAPVEKEKRPCDPMQLCDAPKNGCVHDVNTFDLATPELCCYYGGGFLL